MLDFSVSEIGLVGLVALVAIGPERLPKVARAAGVLFGRFRRYANSVKAEIEREIQQSELQGLQQRMNEAAREVQQQVTQTGAEVETLLNSPAVPADLNTTSVSAPELVPGFSTLPSDTGQLPPLSAPGLSAPPMATVARDSSPFGGDPFSIRGAPRRSVSMSHQNGLGAPGCTEGATAVTVSSDKTEGRAAGVELQAIVENPSP